MINTKAKVLETEATIYLSESRQDNRALDPTKKVAASAPIEEKTHRTIGENRFVRLKKSLRKRSVSIL